MTHTPNPETVKSVGWSYPTSANFHPEHADEEFIINDISDDTESALELQCDGSLKARRNSTPMVFATRRDAETAIASLAHIEDVTWGVIRRNPNPETNIYPASDEGFRFGDAAPSAHTPGPWHVETTAVYDIVRDADGNNIAFLGIQIRPEEAHANAAAIAAMPDLLAACEGLRDWIIANTEGEGTMRAGALIVAHAALAKATSDLRA